MKNGSLSLPTALMLFLLPFLFLSCRIESPNPPLALVSSADLVAVAITPSAPSMAPGSTLQLEALGIFSNSSSRALTGVTWNSADPLLASVNGDGLVTAAAGTGSTIISAVSGSISGSTVLTISPLAAITLSPASASVASGTAQRFVATGILANAVQQDLTQAATWGSSDPALAAVSGAGFASAVTGTTGTATVSATLSGITGTAAFTSARVMSLSVSPGSASIVLGTTRQFRATGTLSDDTVQDLTNSVIWSSSPQAVASVSSTGVAVGNAPGTAVVSASFGAVPASAVLEVTAPVLSSLRITPAVATVPAGTPVQFTALALFSDGGQQDVTGDVAWASSDPAVAIVDNAAGTKGIASALAPGTTRISGTLLGITSDAAVLTVSAGTAPNGLIAVMPLSPVVRVGNSLQLSLVRLSAAGVVVEDLTFTAVWSSSNSAAAFVSHGQVFALSPGTTVITASTGTDLFTTELTVSSF